MSELLEAVKLHNSALHDLNKTMDIFISGNKAIVTKRTPIKVVHQPSYCVGSIGYKGFFWIACDEPGWRPF